MSRDCIGLYTRLLRTPKFRGMSECGQLSLVYVWLSAGDADPEATWPSLAALDDLLALQGRPPNTTEELVERGWLEVADDGTVSAHDWDEHQYAATLAGRRAWETRYMREWRKKPKPLPLTTLSPDKT